MIYLRSLELPDEGREAGFLLHERRTCFSTAYPFKVFPQKEPPRFDFEPITIFCGGNGSGKTTLLNVLGRKLQARRHSEANSSGFFQSYVDLCRVSQGPRPRNCELLTSDDVFDYMLTVRGLNEGIDDRREELFRDYADMRSRARDDQQYRQLHGLEDYDRWKDVTAASSRHGSQSRFVRDRLAPNVQMYSNGETAMRYFTDRIDQDALYLLDEPENSLSIARQITLAEYIQDAARFFRCQFILSTHSPVLLAMKGARIYDLDSVPVAVKRWTELENVRQYFDFFESHRQEFLPREDAT